MTPTDTIGRVAEAIRRVNTETIGLTYSELTRMMARAAIEAMRDLDVAMFDAGAASLYGVSREKAVEYAKEDKFDSEGWRFERAWVAVIDAALGQGGV